MRIKSWICASMLLLATGNILAQGTLEDYQRAYALRDSFSRDKVFYADVTPQWIGDTHSFWYVRRTPEGKVFVKVDADKKQRTNLFDHQKLATALARQSGKEVDAKQLPLDRLSINDRIDTARFVFDQTHWAYSICKNKLVSEGAVKPHQPYNRPHWMVVDEEKTGAPVTSPDGKKQAYIKNDNVYVKDLATGQEKALSIDGTLSNYYSTRIQWSPDSRYVFSARIRPIEKRYVHYVESSPKDQLQPKLHTQEYAKPGDELRFKVPCIYEVETGRAVIPSTELFNPPYDQIGRAHV